MEQFPTFFQMPQVEIVSDVSQNILHVTGNLRMSVRYKCSYDNATSKEEFHAALKSHELHGWAASSLISLPLKKNKA